MEDLTVAYRFYSNCESTETVLKSITENLLSDQEEMFQEDEEYVESVKVKIEPDLYENTVSSESNEQEIEFLETYNYSESEGEIVTPDDQKLVEVFKSIILIHIVYFHIHIYKFYKYF